MFNHVQLVTSSPSDSRGTHKTPGLEATQIPRSLCGGVGNMMGVLNGARARNGNEAADVPARGLPGRGAGRFRWSLRSLSRPGLWEFRGQKPSLGGNGHGKPVRC